MGILSNAVTQERISKVVGYILKKGDFSISSPNLPQSIALFGEANSTFQAGLSTEGVVLATAKAAGDMFGYGSPIYSQMRILKPVNGDGVGGIPITIYPQAEPGGAVASVDRIDITGAATKTTTHKVVINGRDRVDGAVYSFVVNEGDTALEIVPRIVDAINNVLGSPVTAADVLDVTHMADLTSKWKGITAQEIDIAVDTGSDSVGLTYGITNETAGAGAVSIADALSQFKNTWHTIVLNPYGVDYWDELEEFNGIPLDENPTGRYAGIVFKPFFALTGALESTLADLDNEYEPDNRKIQVTNTICPAPNSKGFTWEAAANGAFLLALTNQNSPHLDVSGQGYPDMPVPADGDIGEMSDYDNRDLIVKSGLSTVDLVSGRYEVFDFVTTYRPDGEIPPQFRYVRNLVIDFNVRYGYFILEKATTEDKAIVGSNQAVNVDNTVKPKQVIAVVNSYADDLSGRALIADPDFMKESIDSKVSDTNPDRLETKFRYKRSGYSRILATTGEAGFAFGLR